MIRWILSAVIVSFLIVAGYFPMSLLWRETKKIQSATPFGGKFIKTGDGSLFVQTLGYPEQPAVVFIHAPGAWSETWKPAMRHLAREGYRAVAFDIPPFGLSPASAKTNYTRPAQATRIRDAIDGLGIKNFVLVAHSYGVPAALTTARMMGSRVTAIVLIDAAVGLPKKQGSLIPPPSNWLVKVLKHTFSRNILTSMLTHDWATKPILKKMMIQTPRITKAKLDIVQTPFHYKGNNPKVSAWLAEFYLSRDQQLVTDMKFYEALKMPALIIWGENDPIAPVWQAHEFKARLPNAQVSLLPNVGHIPHVEHEKAFNDTLLKFVLSVQQPVKL